MLRKKIYDSGGNWAETVDYVGPFQFDDHDGNGTAFDPELSFFSHEKGRTVFDGTLFMNQYQLTDHLGNVRVLFSDTDGDGKINPDPIAGNDVLQTTDYYPFGARMAGGNNVVASPPNQYLYNGKELQEEMDLNWYDYGARMYDPVIGRWNGVDALSEKYVAWSPYNYVLGNPIIFVDPDGNSVSYNWDKGRYEDENGKKASWEDAQRQMESSRAQTGKKGGNPIVNSETNSTIKLNGGHSVINRSNQTIVLKGTGGHYAGLSTGVVEDQDEPVLVPLEKGQTFEPYIITTHSDWGLSERYTGRIKDENGNVVHGKEDISVFDIDGIQIQDGQSFTVGSATVTTQNAIDRNATGHIKTQSNISNAISGYIGFEPSVHEDSFVTIHPNLRVTAQGGVTLLPQWRPRDE